jgi:ArsR family transcriptional regulator
LNAPFLHSEQLVQLAKALSDPLRVEVLRLLRQDSYGVLELCKITDAAQPGMSHHLRILSQAGIVETRKEGTSIFYRRTSTARAAEFSDLIQAMFNAIDRVPLSSATTQRKLEVHADRSQRSAQFFERCHAELQDNQELITDFSHYQGCVSDLLSHESLGERRLALEIGSGESRLIEQLSERFDHVLSVDNSEAMLNGTRALCERLGLTNIAFKQADFLSLPPEHPVDLLTLNMVLHHVASPAAFFDSARRWLRNDGRLLLIDLCPHDQDWARDICGDQWLGFEPADLTSWASNAGLQTSQTAYLGLKNGFQIQIHLFQPLNIE